SYEGKELVHYVILVVQSPTTETLNSLKWNQHGVTMSDCTINDQLKDLHNVAAIECAVSDSSVLLTAKNNFGCYFYGVGNRSYSQPAGYLHIKTSQPDCVRTKGKPGDGLDNDCDGLVDEEEILFNDGDGDLLVNEDLQAVGFDAGSPSDLTESSEIKVEYTYVPYIAACLIVLVLILVSLFAINRSMVNTMDSGPQNVTDTQEVNDVEMSQSVRKYGSSVDLDHESHVTDENKLSRSLYSVDVFGRSDSSL
ncbi:hypothetical protein Btru_024978, partial [Bulinus truncatus]